jgi:lipopolysaccharide/colanic/teichoic acid biosynthesis glycosyltransferase
MNILSGTLDISLPEMEWIKNFDPRKRFLTGWSYKLAKRAMDIICVLLLSPLWLPLIILITLIIMITCGKPVLFIQLRTGKGGKRFKMYKFRTMVKNAEEVKKELARIDKEGNLAGPLKLKADPRVTPIGRFLRKTSLDEIPQAINILLGNMSLVGPRPTSWSPESYKLWHTERLDVLPGLTGLWQLADRGGENFDEWLRWDCRYIERRSIWLDFMILVKTGVNFFKQPGAR